jgi:hypothetical protein
MHTPPFYKADFVGMHVRVIERRGNPCIQPELQRHFYSWYRLIVLTTTPENKHIAPGYWHIKLVTVKPSWNPLIKEEYNDAHVIIVNTDEVITDICYGVDVVSGSPVDVIGLTMTSMEDGFKYLAEIRIQHGARPLFPMRKIITNAVP